MSIRVDAKALQRALRKLVPDVNRVIAEDLEGYGKALLRNANEHVPVKSGALYKSGYVQAHSDKGGALTKVEVGYSAEYAAAVHERAHDEDHHKWFEHAFQAFDEEFGRYVVATIQDALDKATK